MLIDAATAFPTVIFTIGLGIALFYWLFVLIGALDIDLFGDASHVGGDGAADGIGDAIGGGHDVGDIGGGHDVGDVGGHDVGDGGGEVGGHDGEGIKLAHGGHHGGGVWSGLGLNKVPMTISISVILLVCWCISLLGMHYGTSVVGNGAWVPGVMLLGTLVVGLPVSGLIVRPFGRVFELREGKSNKDYVGHTCTITTGSVNDTFGQATVEDGGTVLEITVRCDRPDVFARGHKALIIDFDTERQAYVVEPVADMLPTAPKSGAGETT